MMCSICNPPPTLPSSGVVDEIELRRITAIIYGMVAQYHPPVHVPPGWADWFAIGDELH